MTDSPAFGPAPMEGRGAYNRSSRVQAAGLSPAVPLLEQAARAVALSEAPEPVVIADYGSSEGHNSLGPLAVAISVLRERVGPERAILVVHTDLPDNDFTALFRTLAETRTAICAEILPMAVDDGGDFGYQPLLEAMYAGLQKMVEEGFVRLEEVLRMAIPTVGRSRADLVAPFAENGCFAGLSIEQLEVFLGEDRIWAQFEESGDAHTFGARWAAFSRASVFPTLAAGLEGGRDNPRAITFVNRLEADMAARLAAAPERMLIPLAKLSIKKISVCN